MCVIIVIIIWLCDNFDRIHGKRDCGNPRADCLFLDLEAEVRVGDDEDGEGVDDEEDVDGDLLGLVDDNDGKGIYRVKTNS
jgi:hypothetical protein